jgi:predicted transcriptional regulator
LREYRVNLGGPWNKLAEEASISPAIVKRTEEGISVQARTAEAIAIALSKAYGKEIKPTEIV